MMLGLSQQEVARSRQGHAARDGGRGTAIKHLGRISSCREFTGSLRRTPEHWRRAPRAAVTRGQESERSPRA
jgi:hypothetical protein